QEVLAARFARLDAHVREDSVHRVGHGVSGQATNNAPPLPGGRAVFAENRQLRALVLAAAGAGHSRIAPTCTAARAEQATRPGGDRRAGLMPLPRMPSPGQPAARRRNSAAGARIPGASAAP